MFMSKGAIRVGPGLVADFSWQNLSPECHLAPHSSQLQLTVLQQKIDIFNGKNTEGKSSLIKV